jgi:hypothetical protein
MRLCAAKNTYPFRDSYELGEEGNRKSTLIPSAWPCFLNYKQYLKKFHSTKKDLEKKIQETTRKERRKLPITLRQKKRLRRDDRTLPACFENSSIMSVLLLVLGMFPMNRRVLGTLMFTLSTCPSRRSVLSS